MSTFKLTRAMAAMVALLIALAGCGGTATDRKPAGEAAEKVSGSISLMAFGAPEELQAYRNLISEFKKKQPGATVGLVEASDRQDLLARLSTSFAGGTPPDLFLLNYRFYQQFAVKGVLEPVQDRVRSSKLFGEKDFYPQALDAFRYRGKLTCMPQNISSLVVYYNRDMFAKAGVPAPKAGWTWDDMVDVAKKLTKDNDNDGKVDQHGLGIDPELIRVAPFVWSHGGQFVDNMDQPTTFTMHSDAGVFALQKFFDLRTVHRVVPDDAEVEAEDNESRFSNGRLAMVMSSRRSTPTFRKANKFDWDIAGLPTHGQAASVLHSDAYCMTAASKEKDTAWRFLEFAVSAEGQRITAATGRTVPSLIETSNSAAFLDPNAKPANSKVFLDSIPSIQRLPSVSTWPEIEDKANEILEHGFYGTRPAYAVAEQIANETKPIFARAKT